MICICACTSVYTWKCLHSVCSSCLWRILIDLYKSILFPYLVKQKTKKNYDVFGSLHILDLILLLTHSTQEDRAGGKVSHKCQFPSSFTRLNLKYFGVWQQTAMITVDAVGPVTDRRQFWTLNLHDPPLICVCVLCLSYKQKLLPKSCVCDIKSKTYLHKNTSSITNRS